MSIYRSAAGRRRLLTCYDDALSALDVAVDERTVETRHGDTHVLLAGPADGRPLFVFHGGNATNPMTLSWFTGLAEEYRLIAPDTIGQPGYSAETRVDPTGDAYGEWVLDLLDAFDREAAPMVGTSYGAGVVLRSAALAPERIDRAALVVPAGFGTGPLGPLVRVGVLSMLYRYLGRAGLLDRVLDELVTDPSADPIACETIGAALRSTALEREFPTATAEELRGFDAPVAIVLAEDDPFFPPDPIADRARDRLPTVARVETLDDERHVLSPAAQRRVAAVIDEFLDT